MSKSYPPGMIGLACGEISRYSDFLSTLVGLQKPAGTLFKRTTGLGPANPFNDIARDFLSRPQLEWLFLTNDDNLYPQNTIPRLLDCNVDVVTGLYFGRLQPFEPVLFDEVTVKDGKPWYLRHLMEKGERGLHKIAACGDGCLMIRRHVLEELKDPWWEYGESVTDACDHDMVFSRKVREAGLGLYCDFETVVDHIATFAVRPHRNPAGEWEAHLVQNEGRYIALPAASREWVKDEPKVDVPEVTPVSDGDFGLPYLGAERWKDRSLRRR